VDPGHAELAVSPIARAAAVYVLSEGRRAIRTHAAVRRQLAELEGVDLFAWVAAADGSPRAGGAPTGSGAEAVVERAGAELRFRPGSTLVDRRGCAWDVEGDPAALDARVEAGRFDSVRYPDALSRLWSALQAPYAGEILISASPGYELVDWGGVTHCPGGSHGSLDANDSLGPLLLCGLEPGAEDAREQWALSDVAHLVLDHFGVSAGAEQRAGRSAPALS
jgi:hypothetical protein